MEPDDFHTLHVLVVDDEAFIRQLIIRLLRETGVRTISHAGDGKAALEILNERDGDIDLVLCDLEMPRMDGLQFLHTIRSKPDSKFKTLPVIVLTGHSESEVVRSAIKFGVQGYIVKPVSKKILVERIVHAMNQQTQKPE